MRAADVIGLDLEPRHRVCLRIVAQEEIAHLLIGVRLVRTG
jgi:hypothetical protein